MGELYEIEPREFEVIERVDTKEGHLQFTLTTVNEAEDCPLCGSEEFKKKGFVTRKVRDLPAFGKQVGLLIRVQRYKCMECGRTFYIELKSVDSNAKMTKRMKDYIQENSLRKSFSQIEEELSISDTTVKRVFDEYVARLDKARTLEAPRVLGIDENHLLHQYRAIFTDVENGLIIEMLKNRNKNLIVDFLKSLPHNENVQCVTMDMWNPYRMAVKEVLPDATIVVDHFHVTKMINESLESIRRKLREDMDKTERKRLRMSKYLFLRNKEDLSEEQRELLKILFQQHPQFEVPYELKEDFREIYKSNDRFEAEERYEDWERTASKYPQYEGVINTVHSWYDEIFNYFDMPFTNAITEQLNNVINRINDTGRGYSFDVLRAKALYGTQAKKPAKYKYVEPKSTPGFGFTRPLELSKIIHGDGVSVMELGKLLVYYNSLMDVPFPDGKIQVHKY